MRCYRRMYPVGHSYRGFTLEVRDRWLPGWIAECLVDIVATVLGHPCCGRGLFGRFEVVSYAVYRITSAGYRCGYRRDRSIVSLPLTVDEALTLAPQYRDSLGPDGGITLDGMDDNGDVWAAARLVAVRCDDCGALIDADGRWSAAALADHVCRQRHE